MLYVVACITLCLTQLVHFLLVLFWATIWSKAVVRVDVSTQHKHVSISLAVQSKLADVITPEVFEIS